MICTWFDNQGFHCPREAIRFYWHSQQACHGYWCGVRDKVYGTELFARCGVHMIEDQPHWALITIEEYQVGLILET